MVVLSIGNFVYWGFSLLEVLFTVFFPLGFLFDEILSNWGFVSGGFIHLMFCPLFVCFFTGVLSAWEFVN